MIPQAVIETTLSGFSRAIDRYRQAVEAVHRNAEVETRLLQKINDVKVTCNTLEITLDLEVRPNGKGEAGVDVARKKCEAALSAARDILDSALKNLAEIQAFNRKDRVEVGETHGSLLCALDELESAWREGGGLDAALSRIQRLRTQLEEVRLQ